MNKGTNHSVLILVLMEYTLRGLILHTLKDNIHCLNPCFNGIYSQRFCSYSDLETKDQS